MRASWLGVVVLVLGTGAAKASRPQAEVEQPAAPVLAREWTFGLRGQPEPTAKVVPPVDPCGGADPTMLLELRGGEVVARLRWPHPVGGARPAFGRDVSEALSGTFDGKALVLHGEHLVHAREVGPGGHGGELPADVREPVEYRLLRNDRGHLVGLRTQGGQEPETFWAAPLLRQNPGPRCRPRP